MPAMNMYISLQIWLEKKVSYQTAVSTLINLRIPLGNIIWHIL